MVWISTDLVRDEVVVQAAPLVHLQHQAALLRHVGLRENIWSRPENICTNLVASDLVGEVGDGGHVAEAAAVLVVAEEASAGGAATQLQV